MVSVKYKVGLVGISLTLCAAAFAGSASAANTTQPADRNAALIKAVTEQFQIAYRMHPAEARQRQEQLNAVIAAWHSAPRDNANNELLTTWLRTAIRVSMPGSREALPPVPTFTTHEAPVAKVVTPTVVEKRPIETAKVEPTPTPVATPAATTEKSIEQLLADPFRDDPDQDE